MRIVEPQCPDRDAGSRVGEVDLAGLDKAVAFTVTPTMDGIPSKWQPVAVVDRPSSQVIRGIDRILEDLWEENEIEPTVPASDEELLRRVYLDLAGRTPSVTEVRSYLSDTSERRYEELVNRLLNSPDHASHIATVWRRFLIPEGVDLTRFGGIEAFDRWLADRFASNDSYDQVVRSLLLAEGRLSQSGPLLFYSAAKLDADQLASRTSRVFLGMRLECAQCHDHPFEPWTQQDFWRFAAFFSRISRPQAELETVSTVMRVRDIDRGEVMLPDTETVVPPGLPRQDTARGRRRNRRTSPATRRVADRCRESLLRPGHCKPCLGATVRSRHRRSDRRLRRAEPSEVARSCSICSPRTSSTASSIFVSCSV